MTGETILLVEDCPEIRRFSVAALERLGYRVAAASGAREAERLARTHAMDAAVLDLLLPDGHGAELAVRLRQQRPLLPVLFLSGAPPAEGVAPVERSTFLGKPFRVEALADSLRTLLRPRPAVRVLIVDDDPAVRRFASRVLDEAGMDVVAASDGSEALSRAALYAVDVVLTDLVMPEVEGLELIGAMRKQYPGLPVVAMSGKFGGDFLGVALRLGARAAVAKPFTSEQLMAAVRRALS